MTKQFNIHEWKRSRKTINEDDREVINEDGGTYETTIFVQDSGDEVYVHIKDSEGMKMHDSFSDLKGAYDWILEYINQWDLS